VALAPHEIRLRPALHAAGGHSPLACAADPQLASPVSGTTDVCNVSFEASIGVRRLTMADSTVR
jgi:hypothetical protein